MAVLASLVVKIIGDTAQLSSALDKADKETQKFGGAVSKIGGLAAAAAATGGAALAGMAVKGTLDFIAFEQKMNEVFTLLPGITQDAMNDMTSQVKSFSKEFGVLPDKVVPALYQALSAGVPAENVFDFLGTAQKAAVGGVTDLKTAVDGISSVVNAYGADAMRATQASDLMFTAVRYGKLDFNQLSASLYNVVPIASSLGVEFGDVTAALAAMTAQGVPTSVATTQLRQMLVELSKDGSKTSTVFEQIAGQSFREFVASGGNVQQALQLLEGHAAATGVGVNDLFGSVEAGAAALALTGRGTQAFGDALAAMGGSAGATDQAFQRMDSGIGASLNRIRAAIAVAFLDLGAKLAPAVAALADAIQQYLRAATAVVSDLFDRIGAGVSAVLPHVQSLAGVIGSVLLPPLQKVFQFLMEHQEVIVGVAVAIGVKLVAAFTAWAASATAAAAATIAATLPLIAAALPMIALGVAIAAVVAGVLLLIRHWDEIVERVPLLGVALEAVQAVAGAVIGFIVEQAGRVSAYIQEHWPQIQATAEAVWTAIQATAEAVWTAIQAVVGSAISQVQTVITAAVIVLTALWRQFGDDLLAIVQIAWTTIQRVVSGALTVLDGIIKTALALLRGDWQAAWDGVKQIVEGAFAIIHALISGGIATAAQIVRGIKDALGDLTGLLVQAGRDLIAGLISGIMDAAKGAIKAITDVAGNLVTAAKDRLKIWSPSQVAHDEIGLPISEGIAEGILAGEGLVTDAATHVVGQAVRAATDALASFPGAISGSGGMGGGEATIDGAAAQAIINWVLQQAYGSNAFLPNFGRPRPFHAGGMIPEPVWGIGASGRTYTFAERGPEWVVPGRALSGGGGGVTVNINAPLYGVDDVRTIVVEAVKQAQRRGAL